MTSVKLPGAPQAVPRISLPQTHPPRTAPPGAFPAGHTKFTTRGPLGVFGVGVGVVAGAVRL